MKTILCDGHLNKSDVTPEEWLRIQRRWLLVRLGKRFRYWDWMVEDLSSNIYHEPSYYESLEISRDDIPALRAIEMARRKAALPIAIEERKKVQELLDRVAVAPIERELVESDPNVGFTLADLLLGLGTDSKPPGPVIK